MALPCFNDTCSITTNVNAVNNKTDIAVRLDPSGGLTCGTDDNPNSGLRVNVDPCHLDLVSGLLGIIPSRFVDFSVQVGSGSVQIPNTAVAGTSIIEDFDVENPFDCNSLMLVFSRFEVRYQVTAAANDPYDAQFVFRTLSGANTLGNGAIGVNVPIAGQSISAADYTRDNWVYGFGFRVIPGGGSLSFDMTVDNDNGSVGLNTASAGLGGSGHIRALIFPFDLAAV